MNDHPLAAPLSSYLWLVLALTLVTSLGIALLLWLRARRRERTRPAPRAIRLRYPVVLAHGILGFDQLPLLGSRTAYFRAITPHLTRLGIVVHRPRVPALASVHARAEALKRFLSALPNEKVNLVAHSMGGLDARYAIAHLGIGHKVASLTTIGTPHFGTPLADISLQAIARLLNFGRLPPPDRLPHPWALPSLTTSALARFNMETSNDPSVAYHCVIAALPPQTKPSNVLLRLGHAFLATRSGANDGLVPALSQYWGKVLIEVEADHWAQIGWSVGFDARGLYEELLRLLWARGF